MVFHVFDRDSLLDRLRDSHKYLANRYEIQESIAFSKVFDIGLANGLSNVATFLEGGASAGDSNFGPITVTISKVLAKASYIDELPPLDVVITAGKFIAPL